jgi:phosphoadenosine phosphosulfate reductase
MHAMTESITAAVSATPAPIRAELQARADASANLMRAAVAQFGKVVYASSLGAESIVLTDLIWSRVPGIDIVTIDTGRLRKGHLDATVVARFEPRDQRQRLVGQAAAVEQYVRLNGINGFYESLAQRQDCCAIRKVEPFNRAVAGYKAWVTGVRREQSEARAGNQPLQLDARNGLQKVSPLLDWTEAEIWEYIRAKQLPYNPLHDRGFPSIGCAPCTRAIQPGEDHRAGRWWWESAATRECGLQPRQPSSSDGPASGVS